MGERASSSRGSTDLDIPKLVEELLCEGVNAGRIIVIGKSQLNLNRLCTQYLNRGWDRRPQCHELSVSIICRQ